MSGRRAALISLAAGAVALSLLLLAGRPRRTARVDSGPIEQSAVARATVVCRDGVAEIALPHAGKARRVMAREGEAVTEGQPLAEIEPFDRAAAGAQLTLTSPIAGVLLARRLDPGDAAQAGSVAFEVGDVARTELKLEIEEPDATQVTTGMIATVRTPQGEVVGKATVARLAGKLDRRTLGEGEARVRAEGAVRAAWAEWNAPAPSLPPGLRLEAALSLPPRQASSRVPRSAVQVRDGAAFVDVPFALGLSREVTVDLGAIDASYAEVSGVAVGTIVQLR